MQRDPLQHLAAFPRTYLCWKTTRARSCRYVQMSIFKLSLYGKYHFAVMSQSRHSHVTAACVQFCVFRHCNDAKCCISLWLGNYFVSRARPNVTFTTSQIWHINPGILGGRTSSFPYLESFASLLHPTKQQPSCVASYWLRSFSSPQACFSPNISSLHLIDLWPQSRPPTSNSVLLSMRSVP